MRARLAIAVLVTLAVRADEGPGRRTGVAREAGRAMVARSARVGFEPWLRRTRLTCACHLPVAPAVPLGDCGQCHAQPMR